MMAYEILFYILKQFYSLLILQLYKFVVAMQKSDSLEDEDLQMQTDTDCIREVNRSSGIVLFSNKQKKERPRVQKEKTSSVRWYLCGTIAIFIILFQIYIILELQKEVKKVANPTMNESSSIANIANSPDVSKKGQLLPQKVVVEPRNIIPPVPVPEWQPPKHVEAMQPLKLLNPTFSLWDLSREEKINILKKGRELSKAKTHNPKYMDINYDKDDETIQFFKKYEADSYLYEWSSVELTPDQRAAMNEDYQKALQERRAKYRPIIQKYADLYKGKNGHLNIERGIYHSQFVEALANLALTGENIAASPALSALQAREKKYLEERYNISAIKTEIPLCIVTPTYNNIAKRHYIWNTEAILQQEYSNFKWIIVDDASTDDTLSKTAAYLKWRNAPKDRVTLIASRKHRTALENIYYAAHKYCDYGQIMFILDGDDQIIGTQIFKLYNAVYQQQKPYILYSNFFNFNEKDKNNPVGLGMSKDYPDVIKSQSSFRYFYHAYSHLRSSMTDLFLMLKLSSLKDPKGEIYWTLYDNAIFFPSMELACGKIQYIPQILYWYFTNTGNNDYQTPRQKEYGIIMKHIAESQKHYDCVDNKLVDAKKALAVENANKSKKNTP